MTSILANLPHRHVDHETGHIIQVDPATGEILAQTEMVYRKSRRDQYEAWASQRRSENLTGDYATIQAAIAKGFQVPAIVPATATAEAPKQTRGRPKTIYQNPVAAFMPLLVIPDPLPWVDGIIHGSIITSAKVHNGKINVKARAVIGALFLSEISTESCQTGEYTSRTAMRIAKAARHAAHGIASYVERHPEIKAELEAELSVEALFRAS